MGRVREEFSGGTFEGAGALSRGKKNGAAFDAFGFGRAPRTTRARAEAPSELGGSHGAFWRVAAAVAPRDARERRRATRQFPPRFRPSSHLRSELQELLQFALERLVQIRVLHRPTAAVRGRRSHLNTHLAHPRFPLNACVRARREVPRRDAASESKLIRTDGHQQIF